MDSYAVDFPRGTGWYDYWTGRKVSMSQPTVIHPMLDLLPVYARAGSIIPRQPIVQSTVDIPQGPLELLVYPGPHCHGSLYSDDGETFAYKHGDFLRESFTCNVTANAVDIHMTRQGPYKPWWTKIELTVYGAPHATKTIRLNGSAISGGHFNEDAQSVQFTIDAPKVNSTIHVTY